MKRKALFVGIDEYKNITPLRCAWNDAKVLSYAFLKAGYDVDSINDNKATQTNIIEKVEAMTGDLTADDIFVFYFSGHGAEHNGAHYLLGVDARHEPNLLNIASVKIDNLIALTNKPGLKRLFILDCCRSDILASRNVNYACSAERDRCLSKATISTGSNSLPPLILTSCSTGEVSFENMDTKHGYFTNVLLNVIKDKRIHSFDQFRRNLVIKDTPQPQNVCWNGNINMWEDVPLFDFWENGAIDNVNTTAYSNSNYKPLGKTESIDKNSCQVTDFRNIDIKKLKIKANRGDAEAQYVLGSCYLYGIKVNEDWNESYNLLLSAAKKGHILAKFNLAWIDYWNQEELSALETFNEILPGLQKQQNNPECLYNLAVLHENGIAIKKDLNIAVTLYKQSAANEFPPALCKLADFYSDGRAGEKNLPAAFSLYRRAAQQEVIESYIRLGIRYHWGAGVQPNTFLAKKYFKQAAESGNHSGAYFLFAYYLECFSDKEEKLEKSLKNIIIKYRNKIPGLFNHLNIPSACERFICTSYPTLLGGYCKRNKYQFYKKYDFFAICADGLFFYDKGVSKPAPLIEWIDMESITAASDGIIINDYKLIVSERIGSIVNLLKEIRNLFVEYFPDLCN